jgi:hypothetical protein
MTLATASTSAGRDDGPRPHDNTANASAERPSVAREPGAASGPSFDEAFQAARAAFEAGTKFHETATQCATVMKGAVHRQLTERPYVVLGIAAFAGFLLAGGVARPAGRKLVKLGLLYGRGRLLTRLGSSVFPS